jgi:hypothetical protein
MDEYVSESGGLTHEVSRAKTFDAPEKAQAFALMIRVPPSHLKADFPKVKVVAKTEVE